MHVIRSFQSSLIENIENQLKMWSRAVSVLHNPVEYSGRMNEGEEWLTGFFGLRDSKKEANADDVNTPEDWEAEWHLVDGHDDADTAKYVQKAEAAKLNSIVKTFDLLAASMKKAISMMHGDVTATRQLTRILDSILEEMAQWSKRDSNTPKNADFRETFSLLLNRISHWIDTATETTSSVVQDKAVELESIHREMTLILVQLAFCESRDTSNQDEKAGVLDVSRRRLIVSSGTGGLPADIVMDRMSTIVARGLQWVGVIASLLGVEEGDNEDQITEDGLAPFKPRSESEHSVVLENVNVSDDSGAVVRVVKTASRSLENWAVSGSEFASKRKSHDESLNKEKEVIVNNQFGERFQVYPDEIVIEATEVKTEKILGVEQYTQTENRAASPEVVISDSDDSSDTSSFMSDDEEYFFDLAEEFLAMKGDKEDEDDDMDMGELDPEKENSQDEESKSEEASESKEGSETEEIGLLKAGPLTKSKTAINDSDWREKWEKQREIKEKTDKEAALRATEVEEQKLKKKYVDMKDDILRKLRKKMEMAKKIRDEVRAQRSQDISRMISTDQGEEGEEEEEEEELDDEDECVVVEEAVEERVDIHGKPVLDEEGKKIFFKKTVRKTMKRGEAKQLLEEQEEKDESVQEKKKGQPKRTVKKRRGQSGANSGDTEALRQKVRLLQTQLRHMQSAIDHRGVDEGFFKGIGQPAIDIEDKTMSKSVTMNTNVDDDMDMNIGLYSEADRAWLDTGKQVKSLKKHSSRLRILMDIDTHPLIHPETGPLQLAKSRIRALKKRTVKHRTWLIRALRELLDAQAVFIFGNDGKEMIHALQRKGLPDFVFDIMTQKFGLKTLVEQNCWDLLAGCAKIRIYDEEVEIFSRFLEESMPRDELTVYLYARQAALQWLSVGTRVPEDPQSPLPVYVCLVRANAVAKMTLDWFGCEPTAWPRVLKQLKENSIHRSELKDKAFDPTHASRVTESDKFKEARSDRRIPLTLVLAHVLREYRRERRRHISSLSNKFMSVVEGENEERPMSAQSPCLPPLKFARLIMSLGIGLTVHEIKDMLKRHKRRTGTDRVSRDDFVGMVARLGILPMEFQGMEARTGPGMTGDVKEASRILALLEKSWKERNGDVRTAVDNIRRHSDRTGNAGDRARADTLATLFSELKNMLVSPDDSDSQKVRDALYKYRGLLSQIYAFKAELRWSSAGPIPPEAEPGSNVLRTELNSLEMAALGPSIH